MNRALPTFALQLKKQQDKLGVSQDELPKLAGVTLHTLTEIESGETPYPRNETLRRIAKSLIVGVGDSIKQRIWHQEVTNLWDVGFIMNDKWTFFLVKPDAVSRGLVTSIFDAITEFGFMLQRGRSFTFSGESVIEFYRPFISKSISGRESKLIMKSYTTYLTGGECIYVKAKIGKTPVGFKDIFAYSLYARGLAFFPEECDHNSIRYRFRDKILDSSWIILSTIPGWGRLVEGFVPNLLHCPGSIRERNFQFNLIERGVTKKQPASEFVRH